jgi:hypothetical protein
MQARIALPCKGGSTTLPATTDLGVWRAILGGDSPYLFLDHSYPVNRTTVVNQTDLFDLGLRLLRFRCVHRRSGGCLYWSNKLCVF